MNQKSYLNKNKKSRGITLVALVVTIVVLLILAGITITMLFSDSGIITKAREAAEATNKAQSDTEQGIENLENKIGQSLAVKAVQGKLVSFAERYGKYTDKTSSEMVPVPGGYCVVNDGKNEKNTIASGLVISDLEGDTLDNEEIDGKRGNQFVWVPVPDANTIYEVKDGRNVGKLYEFGKYNNSNWETYETPQKIEYSETGRREPDVVTKTLSSETEIEGNDAITGNLDIITDLTDKTPEGFKKLLQSEFDSMIESVEKYGGFYIGRYETQGMSAVSDVQTVTPTVKKGETPSININWYYMYQESKNIGKDNDNVTSSMIWGCQWDRTLDWIAQTNPKEDKTTPNYELLTNSTDWGNYNDSKETTHGSLQNSGSNDKWQKNHIYDLAGNVREWTLESNGTNVRVNRGGEYDLSGSFAPACQRGGNDPIKNIIDFGSRSTLYINP